MDANELRAAAEHVLANRHPLSELEAGTINRADWEFDEAAAKLANAVKAGPLGVEHVPAHAWRDDGFRKAVGLLWGYFHSPETHVRERFGDVREPWAELTRLVKGEG